MTIKIPQPQGSEPEFDDLMGMDWFAELFQCPQDPIHHAEGDVGIHTRMVCRELWSSAAWRDLKAEDRETAYLAALLHDVAKPATTRTEPDGRITARGHSALGARMARTILWRKGYSFRVREMVAQIIRVHQFPFFLIERDLPEREVVKLSQNVRLDLLGHVAEADIRGRICRDLQKVLDNIELFREFAREQNCYDKARAFKDGNSRFLYARDRWFQPELAAHGEFGSRVILMSGLPGAGKDTWIQKNCPDLPVLSPDQIRRELGIAPGKPQGQVIAAAREQAKQYLRQNQDFVWNATNITAQMREGCISLLTAYKAHVRLIYLDVPYKTLVSQNRNREHVVPDAVLNRLIDKLEVPTRDEAHEVEHIIREESC